MGRIAAIDFGLKRSGLAISDEKKTFSLPWTTVHGGLKELLTALRSRKDEIETIIMGLPLLMNGQKGEMAMKVEAFAKILEKEIQIPVLLFDERLSSKQANAVLRELGGNRKKRKETTDEIAACLLLEVFLHRTPSRDF